MQAFIKYANRPSNKADYWGIFDGEARFSLGRPQEVQRKAYFDEQFQFSIMSPFYHHLRRTGIITGSSDAEIAANIEKGNIDHDQLVVSFSSWLEQKDTLFVYLDKPKQEVKPITPPPNHLYSAPVTQTPQQPPRSLPYASNQKYAENKKEPPFTLQKMPENQTPHKSNNVYTSYQTTQNQIKQMQERNMAAQMPPPSAQEEKPFRVRFLEKLADYFEYPERVVTIRNQIGQLFHSQKK